MQRLARPVVQVRCVGADADQDTDIHESFRPCKSVRSELLQRPLVSEQRVKDSHVTVRRFFTCLPQRLLDPVRVITVFGQAVETD